ncbi:hypothetical protein DM860_006276 [Cuscuta australis]|uniref:Nudix hydrolase domain-containing protein n=1 Tax=Cuscuta australis TaxID=267555 RepID=A0A328DK63_9ASTE|nr:hypothetical protein DM860_006276 [Cuscuta australis]
MEKKADGSEFKLLLSCPSGISPSQMSVAFDQLYDRVPHRDPILEGSISEVWEKRVQQSPSLFNGLKFRYGGYIFKSIIGSPQEPHVCLHLGLTDYRTFVGTNLSPLWKKFLVQSEDDCSQCQHTSNPLGNGAIVETSDKKILVLRRSNNVGEFPGYFVFPGGHPEPNAVGLTCHKSDTDPNHCEIINRKASQEMFDSISREVVEETGVPAANLSTPIFIGISQRVLNVRPTAFFFIKCNLPAKEIQDMYSGAEDSFESTQLQAVSMSELESLASKMPGCHRGGLELYKLMQKP